MGNLKDSAGYPVKERAEKTIMTEAATFSPAIETSGGCVDGEELTQQDISLIRFMRKHGQGTIEHFEFAEGKPKACRNVTLGQIDRIVFGNLGITVPEIMKGQ